MSKHSSVFQPRIVRIVEIIFLSLFNISFFIPYVYGVKPKEFIWDSFGNSSFNDGWSWIVIVSFPIILSFVLLIWVFVKPRFGQQTLSLLTWLFAIIYSFVMLLFLYEEAMLIINNEYLGVEVYIILPLVFSLFLFVFTMLKSKEKSLKIENFILSIITIPVVYFFFGFLTFDFGGYLLNICFAVLYAIAVLKIFLAKQFEESPTA